MGFLGYMKDILTVASILGLVIVGLTIALRSGVAAMGPDRSRLVLANLSQLVLTLAGCLLVLGMIQQLIGFRLPQPGKSIGRSVSTMNQRASRFSTWIGIAASPFAFPCDPPAGRFPSRPKVLDRTAGRLYHAKSWRRAD